MKIICKKKMGNMGLLDAVKCKFDDYWIMKLICFENSGRRDFE